MADYGEPNMSDATLLVRVEDLINMAMGPSDQNIVNFKLIQTVLHILARQMRMLEQRVEIRITDETEPKKDTLLKHKMDDIREEQSIRSPEKQALVKKAEKSALKEKVKEDRVASKERDKADRAVSKEREKAEKVEAKEREKEERAAAKDKDKQAIAEYKERTKAETADAKERERAETASTKEKEKGERASSKERGKAEKEREKAEKSAKKDIDKAERASSKEREKPDKAAEKEREKAERVVEKGDKAALKEKEKAEKAAAKDQEKEEKTRAKKERKGKAPSDTSILVSEVERRNEKVLVVEKGSPSMRSDGSRENIEVVTRSEFDVVQAMVKDLQQRAGPLPPPSLPDNKKLMKDLAKGNATLTDTMQAMQVEARVRAAEKAIGRMGDMLTALAAAGALPEDIVVKDLKFEPLETDAAHMAQPEKFVARDGLPRKSVAIVPTELDPSTTSGAGRPSSATSTASRPSVAAAMGRPSVASAISKMSTAGGLARPSTVSKASSASTAGVALVTHPEMDSAIQDLSDELIKTVQNMTAKATAVAENASMCAKAVSDKVEIALKLDMRISTLNSLVSDYADQLSGFDSGLTTQMSSFREQITQMKAELKAGLQQLDQVNNNAETAAVMELTERYEGLVSELDQTMNTHRALTAFQQQLGDELHSLVECVEMLREEKADRDEVLDGLRDKADNSRLAGLLTAIEFNIARQGLERRLDVCHDKFKRQENVWMTALKDLTRVTESKAEITQLLAAREAAEKMLRELHDKQERLAVILGEPKAAMLTRMLARDAVCGSCLTPALMEPQDPSYGAPPALPAARPRPLGAEEPCAPDWKPPQPPDNREHICHRWCGGSHTLLSEAVTRERAPPVQLQAAPTNRYSSYGSDGKLYMFEEELQPCVECNMLSEKVQEEPAPAPRSDGAGDQGPPP